MKLRPIAYSAAELTFLEARKDHPRRQLHDAFCARFGRDDVSLKNLIGLMKRKGWLTGRTGRFPLGIVPANKGKKLAAIHPASVATQFKKGHRGGRAAQIYKPIGTERISNCGYVERKINDDMPLQSRWRAVHLIRWEKLNGPLPKSHALKCLDGDKQNTDPANWSLVPRGMLPRLNGKSGRNYDTAAPETKPAIMAIAKLEHAARSMRPAKPKGRKAG